MHVKIAFTITSIVHGYHVYKDIWEAEITSELPCWPELSQPEPNNHEHYCAMVILQLFQSD